LKKELPINNLLNKIPTPFFFNPFKIWEEQNSGKLVPLYPSTINFYTNDIISNNSTTMGECSLFLNKENNFSLEEF
jgi:hypothetical protein